MIFGKGKKTVGKSPAVILTDPKYSRNVSQVVRACSCFGVEQCWFTGNRVQIELENAKRLPREERMKGYSSVDIIQYDYPFEQFKGATVVGIEVVPGAEMLTDFEHPENAVYVFGPEDGGLNSMVKGFCHRFVFIPMRHCSNLAAAVYITLYDRMLKRYWNGQEEIGNVDDVLSEPRGWSKFEDEIYGDLESHKNKSIKEILK